MTRVGRVDDGVAAALLGTPSARGPRIRRVTGSFTDGPFVETKELLG